MSQQKEVTITSVKHTTSNASIQVSSYGATLISYKDTNNYEYIFVSKNAIYDGTAPIRGGIPIVFPIFGPPNDTTNSTMPQHGYARRNVWNLIKTYDTTESAGIIYELNYHNDVIDGCGTNNIWSKVTSNDSNNSTSHDIDCTLQLHIDFHGNEIKSTLHITNTSTTNIEFPFQCLLHTYYSIANHNALNPTQCYVQGLYNYICDDKVTKENKYIVTTNDPITISNEVDRIYTPQSQSNNNDNHLNVTIGIGNNKTIHMEAYGQKINNQNDNDDDTNTTTNIDLPISCVVWNPYITKAKELKDFDNEEYNDMLCIEPGILDTTNTTLLPNQSAYMTQIIKIS